MNPVYKVFETKKPFVYFHTHVIDESVLRSAVAARKSLEVDMAIAEDGSIFIGHPLSFYEFKHLPPPNNLPLDDVLKTMSRAGLYLVIDCKDIRALPKVKQTIESFGAENVLFHAWADELLFKPYPSEIEIEPHWPYEDLPLVEILKLKRETGVPVIASARGLTQKRLSQDKEVIVEKILDAARGRIEAINFNLPGGEAPPKDIMQRLLKHKTLTWFNIDKVPPESRPPLFLGVTDDISAASDPINFA